MDQEMERRLWEYIDGKSTSAEKALIDLLLAENQAWQNKYEELTAFHKIFQGQELDMPSLRFTKKVMEEIAQYQVAPATKNYINKNLIHGIAAFFLVMITGLLIYLISQFRWTSYPSNNFLQKYNFEADQLNWGKVLNNTYVNIFIGINVILGLILLDRYLQGKKNNPQSDHWPKSDSA